MEVNERLREEIFGIIERQKKMNDPPETRATLKRLQALGYSYFESKQLIGQCLAIEFFNVLKLGQDHDEKRYIRNLRNLPHEPMES